MNACYVPSTTFSHVILNSLGVDSVILWEIVSVGEQTFSAASNFLIRI